ncbi:MAG: hypothetical protein ACRDV4_07250 [Acidimicrobiales bacterium]
MGGTDDVGDGRGGWATIVVRVGMVTSFVVGMAGVGDVVTPP